ncbi:MAG: hypothetical protein P1P64_02600 [Treponemataceae bacterium]
MGKIYKYEMIRRSKAIFILGGIMLGMTLISIILSLLFRVDFNYVENMPMYARIWCVLTLLAISFIPLLMFFTCSHAHIKEMLYRDTNYLMLTIPLSSRKILLGRWLAGLTEYIIYVALSFISIFSWLTIIMPSLEDATFFLKLLVLNIFGNPVGVFVVLSYALSLFALVGMTIIMVQMFIRSFIKKRGLTFAIAIVAYIFMFFVMNDIAINLSLRLNWNLPITITAFSANDFHSNIVVEKHTWSAPMVLPIVWLALSTGFFFISSWLLEKKVEV